MDLAMIECWIVPSILTIAAVLVLRFVLRGKISLRLQYALWTVVLVRLLLPFQIFVTPLSADALVEELDIPGTMQQAYVSANNEQYQQQYDFAYHDSVEYYESKGQQVDPVVADQRAAVTARQSLVLELRLRLMNLWLLGMAAMALVIASCNLHFALRLRRSRRTFPAADSLLPVYVTDAVPTPCVFGLFRPAIYLTSAATEDETVLRHALTHELTHYRHLDHIWSVLRSLCLVLHWYNPLVWIAAKVSRADAELACDEGALARLGENQRGDYGRTLIGLTCTSRVDSMVITATTITGSAGSIRERIRLLMKRPRNTVLTVIAVILMVTLIVGCTFAGAPETAAPTGHAPDNDMSYTGQELPIPDDLTASDLRNDEGLLVFPGTEWGMSEEELLNALNIQKYGTFSGMRGIHLPTTTFCGYSASIAFYFGQYDNHQKWGLTEVTVRFADAEAANAVCDILTGQLGESDFQTSGVTSCAWRSEARLEDLLLPEAYAFYREQYTESLLNSGAASTIAWFGKGDPEMENTIVFSSPLYLARQVEAHMEVTDPVAGDGLLAYPGTRWFMTENEVLAALGMTARDILQGAYTTQENGMTASSVTINHKDAFGVSMVLDFTFRAYWPGAEPVLTEVYGHFIDREGFEAVRSIYARAMGDTDTRITPGVVEQWDSQILLRELVGMEGYEILDRCAADALNIPAAHVQWVDNGTPEIIWSTELPDPGTPDWSNQPLAENP